MKEKLKIYKQKNIFKKKTSIKKYFIPMRRNLNTSNGSNYYYNNLKKIKNKSCYKSY